MMAPPPQMGPPPVVVKKGLGPVAWVLIILGCLFLFGFIGIVGTGLFIAHKVKQAGLDPVLMSRNPGLALGKLVAAANPDAEVVNTDDSAGTMTIRDRKTGKVMKFSFDDIRNGKFNMKVEGDDGTVSIGASTDAKLPSLVPDYPGSKAAANFAITGKANNGEGEGGNFTFTTSDPADKVMSFYQDKVKDLGMKMTLTTNTPEGGMFVATDEVKERSLTVVVGRSGAETTVNLTYGVKH